MHIQGARVLLAVACLFATAYSSAQAAERPKMPRYTYPSEAKKAPPAEAPTELDPITVTPQNLPMPRVHYNPPYPMSARNRWEEGCVVLEYTVRTDGKTDDFKVLEANPPGVFEANVIMAVTKWQYDPQPYEQTFVEHFEFVSSAHRSSPTFTVVSARGHRSGSGRTSQVNNRISMVGYKTPTCRLAGGR